MRLKKIKLFISMTTVAFSLIGCGEQAKINQATSNIEMLTAQEEELKASVADLQAMETAEKIRTGTELYIVELDIRQSHFTLDIGEHIKDDMNALTFAIEVSPEFYDNVQVGDVLDDSFRAGSFLFHGSIGNWQITVKDKYIQ